MTNTDLEMFMENLKRLIDSKHSKLITSNQFIEAKKPEIILLYEELGYLIGSCFKDMALDEELDQQADMENCKKRLMDVAREAEDIVNMFISSAILKNDDSFRDDGPSNVLDYSLNLNDVMDDLKSNREYTEEKKLETCTETLNINNTIQHLVKKGIVNKMFKSKNASQQAVGSSSTRNPEIMNQSAKEREDVIVGFDEDAILIMDRLAGDRKQLDIISIVGMGGLGKTTLATKIFNDHYVVYYFDVRGWITVSQAYSKRDFLMGLLASLGKSDYKEFSEQKLSEMLYRSLKGRKYLIIIDDIWSAKAWDDLRRYFPDDKTGSRIVLTTRLTEVALHASHNGFTHHQRYLTEEESWELLLKKTFRGDECPKSLIEIGKHIARKCQGLPLALVVIAGLLEKGEKSKKFWDKVGKSVSSYVVDDPTGCLEMLALSYDHLPPPLRNCFLYVGGFPEDYKIPVRRLIRIWMAEGFVREAGQKSLEEQAETYLIDLVDRNLLIVADRRSNCGIKSILLHDLLRELCLKKATEEKFFTKIGLSPNNPFSSSSSIIDKQHRLFTDYKVLCEISSHHFATHTRSVLCFSNSQLLGKTTGRWAPSFMLLRVLDLLNISRADLREIHILFHLRYLAVWSADQAFPSSMGNLWNLQTLILKGKFLNSMYSPDKMANMLNLRHLWSERIITTQSVFPVLFNLQTISRLKLEHDTQRWQYSFPNIKKLGCSVCSTSENCGFLNFALLTNLQNLNLQNDMDTPLPVSNPITFPETLKKLTLRSGQLPPLRTAPRGGCWKILIPGAGSSLSDRLHVVVFPWGINRCACLAAGLKRVGAQVGTKARGQPSTIDLFLKGCHLPWIYMSTIHQLPKLEVLKLLDSSFQGPVWDASEQYFHQLKFLKLEKLNIQSWEASSINFPCLRKLVVRTCKSMKGIPQEIGDIFTLKTIEIDTSAFLVVNSVNIIQKEQHSMGNYDLKIRLNELDKFRRGKMNYTDHYDSYGTFYKKNPFYE